MAKFGNLIRVSFRKLKNIIKDETLYLRLLALFLAIVLWFLASKT